ncbi:hypothetical protein [Burkholderia phage vB_BglM_WTB]
MHFNTLAFLGYLESKQFCERSGIEVPTFPEYRKAVSEAAGFSISATGNAEAVMTAMKEDIAMLQAAREADQAQFDALSRGDKLAAWAFCTKPTCLCATRFRLAINNPHIEV